MWPILQSFRGKEDSYEALDRYCLKYNGVDEMNLVKLTLINILTYFYKNIIIFYIIPDLGLCVFVLLV